MTEKSKYKSLSEWQKAHPSAYTAAFRKGLLQKICEHFSWNKKKPVGYWTLDKCKKDALNYNTKKEWNKNSAGFSAAVKKGWIDACCNHMIKNRNWTIETCKEDALKYKTKSSWKKSSTGYDVAQKNGWSEECCTHMREAIRPSGYWTLENCKEDALKYNTRLEWKKKHGHVYRIAQKNGWSEECCVHMKISSFSKGYWTFERCKEGALKYKFKTQWRENSPGYHAAVRYGWIEECCKHMVSGYKEEQLKRNAKRKISI